MKTRLVLFALFCAGFVACSSTANPVTPGIEGTWSAPLQPSGAIILVLHPASGCALNAPCQLTGTFQDNKNGGKRSLTNAQINGNAVSLQATIGAEGALSDAQCALGLDQSQLKMSGTCTMKGQYSNSPQTFPVSFVKQ